jgi:hypothetical protein
MRVFMKIEQNGVRVVNLVPSRKPNCRRVQCFHITSLTHSLTHLLTYLLHGTGHYLKIWWSLSLSINSLLSLWTPNVHYRVHKSPPLDPILCLPNTVRPIDPCLPKVQLNVVLPPKPRSTQRSPTVGPPNQNPVNTSPLCVSHVPPTSSPLI